MDRKWTSEQSQAIASRQGNFLVSAGAGSGKTAVLTERIRQIVDSKDASLQELLVLTFTDKAAHEMKERIRDAFLNEGELSNADAVESADITTFDAFAFSLVRKYHYRLSLPSDIVIFDEAFLQVTKRKLLDGILERHYREKEPSFLDFVRHYALKDDDQIITTVLAILDKSELSPSPKAFFRAYEEGQFADAAMKDAEDAYFRSLRDELSDLNDATSLYEDSELAAGEDEFLASPLASSSFDDLYGLVLKEPYPRLTKTNASSPRDKAIHKALADRYAKLRRRLLLLGTYEEQRSRFLLTKPYVRLFVSLAEELQEALLTYKKEKGAYSFADIAAFARDLAASDDLGPSLKAKYRYVMVDEYQDTSDLQESFIVSLSKDNLFVVGDVKQSIYGFRNANPSLFLARYEAYRQGHGGTLITLNDNFRSREEVLTGLNALFASAMSDSLGGVTYDKSQALRFGNMAAYPNCGDGFYQNELLVYTKEEGVSQAEDEAKIIASDILSKLRQGFLVSDGKGGRRPANFSDFAILIARKRDFFRYEKIFAAAKIPMAATEAKDLADEDVSLTFLSLLKLVFLGDGDETRLRHCYASLKRSYLYQEKDAEIYADLMTGAYRQDPLLKEIEAHRTALSAGSAEEGVVYLLHAFPFLANLPRLGEVKANFEKLLSFRSQAALADRMGLSFKEFAAYFDELKTYEVDLSLPSSEEGGEAVRLMSIHASKGLEFPVVYCPDLAAKANRQDVSGGFLVDKSLGVLLPLTLEEGDPYTFRHFLAKERAEKAELSERMRLFYVALTRAKEKLVLLEKNDKGNSLERVGKRTLLSFRSEGDDLKASFHLPSSFTDFLALGEGRAFARVAVAPLTPSALPVTALGEKIPAPEFRTISVPPLAKEPLRASKASLLPGEEGALAYGTRLHRLLELADFRTKDLSFITEPKEREIVGKVLALPLFDNLQDVRIYKEYAFFDSVSLVRGSIDLLLVGPEGETIVDYKTRSLADEAYKRQLSLYRAYIERVYRKKASTWLLSILDGTLVEVK